MHLPPDVDKISPMETVSVIIPTWNRAHTLERAIASALNQTRLILEILVCDDGSTDSSQEIVSSFSDERVVWLEGNHAGLPAKPRNRGLKAARGEWIAFLDSDDQWEAQKVERQLAALGDTNASAICSNAFRFFPGSTAPPALYFAEKITGLVNLSDLLQTNTLICSSVLFHRSLLSTIEGFPESSEFKAIEDYALWLRIACLQPILYLSDPLVSYCDNPMESVRRDDLSPAKQRLRVRHNLLEWASRHPEKLDSHTKSEIQEALGTAKRKVNKNRHGFIRKLMASVSKCI